MNHAHLRTFFFFVLWGLIYGITLGAIAGTLIFPYFGTLYATAWGLGIGGAMGVASGILLAIYNAVGLRFAPDWSEYRQRITPIVGSLVSLGAGGLLIATTQNFLWGVGTEGFFPYFLPSLGAAMFWGGLSSAYAASRYADWYASITTKQKYDVDVNESLPEKLGVVQRFVRLTFSKHWWLLGVGAVLGLILTANISATMIGVIIAAGAMLLYSVTIGLLIAFLNRLYFLEYAAHESREWYRLRVKITTGLFLFTAASIFAFPIFLTPYTVFSLSNLPIILLPLLTTFTGVHVAHHYANWYHSGDKEKIKGLPRLALQEEYEAELEALEYLRSEEETRQR